MLQSKDKEWLNGYKNKTHIYAAYKRIMSDLKTHIDWNLEDRKRYFMQMEIKKKAWVAILISDKIDFKTKTVTRDKGHYIMIKKLIQQEDLAIINIYAPNQGAPKYIKQILT